MDAKQAIELLRKHDTLRETNQKGYEIYQSLTHQQAQEIVAMIESLSAIPSDTGERVRVTEDRVKEYNDLLKLGIDEVLRMAKIGKQMQSLIKALTDIAEESTDIGAIDCAKDALAKYGGENAGEDVTPKQPAPLKEYKASLRFYGIEETETIEAENMKEAEKELVQWVLEQIDHWCEEIKEDKACQQ